LFQKAVSSPGPNNPGFFFLRGSGIRRRLGLSPREACRSLPRARAISDPSVDFTFDPTNRARADLNSLRESPGRLFSI
jgi:hypothetical protein